MPCGSSVRGPGGIDEWNDDTTFPGGRVPAMGGCPVSVRCASGRAILLLSNLRAPRMNRQPLGGQPLGGQPAGGWRVTGGRPVAIGGQSAASGGKRRASGGKEVRGGRWRSGGRRV